MLHHAGAENLGGALMLLFFVTIGAAAGSPKSILGCGWLAGFMIVQLAVHLGVVLGIGKAAGLPMQVSHPYLPNFLVLHAVSRYVH